MVGSRPAGASGKQDNEKAGGQQSNNSPVTTVTTGGSASPQSQYNGLSGSNTIVDGE